jgi:hypothetical protein
VSFWESSRSRLVQNNGLQHSRVRHDASCRATTCALAHVCFRIRIREREAGEDPIARYSQLEFSDESSTEHVRDRALSAFGF